MSTYDAHLHESDGNDHLSVFAGFRCGTLGGGEWWLLSLVVTVAGINSKSHVYVVAGFRFRTLGGDELCGSGERRTSFSFRIFNSGSS